MAARSDLHGPEMMASVGCHLRTPSMTTFSKPTSKLASCDPHRLVAGAGARPRCSRWGCQWPSAGSGRDGRRARGALRGLGDRDGSAAAISEAAPCAGPILRHQQDVAGIEARQVVWAALRRGHWRDEPEAQRERRVSGQVAIACCCRASETAQ